MGRWLPHPQATCSGLKVQRPNTSTQTDVVHIKGDQRISFSFAQVECECFAVAIASDHKKSLEELSENVVPFYLGSFLSRIETEPQWLHRQWSLTAIR